MTSTDTTAKPSVKSELWENIQTILVALTGYGYEEDRRKSEAAGFDHHLVKPLDFQLVHRILDGWRQSGGCEN